ncbi:hypothetical protein KUCAC02_026008 [Chaenocephalus aceratus]|uniref:Uncharacterized protein n=1 Tax=Chaenocephalus aceratus TaxID=36190 RepID=A0ACB9VVH2_CHAAC|nr:hypothetical protein KUCAC02_026008 [Chaenocephalus aceratus]
MVACRSWEDTRVNTAQSVEVSVALTLRGPYVSPFFRL